MSRLLRFSFLVVALLLIMACWPFNTPTPPPPNPIIVQTLTLAVQAQPPTYNTLNQPINYNFLVTNTGTSPLPGPVAITDNKMVVVSCPEVTSVGNKNGNLDPAEAITCTGGYAITQADLSNGSMTNTSTVTVGGQSSNPVNTTIQAQLNKVLTIAVTANPTSFNLAGQNINFTYVVTNTGPTPVGPTQIVVKDTLIPSLINCGPNTTTLATNQTVSCNGTYTTTATDATAAQITSTASATTPTGAGTIQPATTTVNNSTVPIPPVSTLVPGTTITHQVVVGEWLLQISRCYGANFKAVVAANPQVPNPNVIFAQRTTVKVPNIGSNGPIYGPKDCVVFYKVVSGDTWESIANKYNADVNVLRAANPGVTLSPGVVVKVPNNSKGGIPVTPAPTVLNLTKSPNPNVYSAVGQTITYNYAVTNSGTASVVGPVTIADNKIPAVTCANLNTVGNKDGNLDAGESVACSAVYMITQADLNAGLVTNTATASAGGQNSNQVSATIKAQQVSILSLSVSANPTSYTQVGQNIIFTYTITNPGATPLGPAQFVVNDTRIPGPINCGPNTTTLASNQSVSCTATYTTTQADITAGQIVSSATASGPGAGTSQPVVTTIRYNVPSPQPIRLTFPPGSPSSLSQPGTITTPGTIRYVFAAVAGQTLNVQLMVPTNDVNLAVYGPNNTTLKTPDAVNTWNGTLPATGDYFVDLISSVGVPSKTFTLNLTLTSPASTSNTERVADIYPGSGSSNPSYLSPFNAQLYFQANGNNNAGAELWRYDRGTNAAAMVADIYLGPTGSTPTSLRPYQNMLYFGANGNDGAGNELWRFNGSSSGRVNDLYSGEGSSNPMYMTEFNGELYFSANANDGHGVELWKYNGTTSATTLAADINQGPGNSNPSYLAVYNNTLYFAATTTNGGTELWKFDGTNATLASDITPGAGNANPAFLAVFNNLLYFSANGNNGAGTELWKFDGTTASMAADINPGPADSAPTYMTPLNNALFFGAIGNASGFELWKFDGTTASMAADINPTTSSNPAYLAVYNNELYFQATGNDGAGAELWKYKGP